VKAATASAAPRIHRLGGSGEPVLLLHGFGADRLSWLANQHDLTGIAEVHSLDLPGHGDEPSSGEGTISSLALAVAAALEEAEIEAAHLVGHSLGGAVAITLAANYPSRVRSLSLIAPAGLGRGIDADFLTSFPHAETAETMEPLLQRLVSRPRLINRHMVARAREPLERPGRREGLARLAEQLKAVDVAMAASIATVAESEVPRMVFWGASDTINPPDLDRLKAFGGSLMMVDDAAHMPHVEAFKSFNPALSAFLLTGGKSE